MGLQRGTKRRGINRSSRFRCEPQMIDLNFLALFSSLKLSLSLSFCQLLRAATRSTKSLCVICTLEWVQRIYLDNAAEGANHALIRKISS